MPFYAGRSGINYLSRLKCQPGKYKISTFTIIFLTSYIFFFQLQKKSEAIPEEHANSLNLNPCGRAKTNCTIFLGFTSNMISSGVRDTIRFLVQHNMVIV